MAPKSKATALPPALAGNSVGSSKPNEKPSKGKGKADAERATVSDATAANAVDDARGQPSRGGRFSDVPVWQWTTLTERSISRHPAVFTPDAKYFFIIVSASVKVYSATTGAVVSTLSAFSNDASSSASTSTSPGHRRTITSIMIHPGNPLQLVTASLDGTIKIWDYLDALLLDTIDLERPVTHMCADTSKPDSVFIASAPKSNKTGPKERSVIYRVSLRQSVQPDDAKPVYFRVTKTQSVHHLVMSPSGRWLIIAGATKIYAAAVSPARVGEMTKYTSPQLITSFAFHPTDEYFATGCDTGVIRLWYCLNGEKEQAKAEKNAQTTMLHWHAHAVSSLTFTPNGAYLLSGGEEAVLVIWQLDANKKDFVPRVGAPIVSIAVTPVAEQSEGYLLCLQDGTLMTIDAAKHTVRLEIPRIKLAPLHFRPPTTEPPPLAVHEASSSIVLPSSHPSSIQFYDPFTFALKYELEVAPSNRVSRVQDEHTEPPRVLCTATCSSGRWLATVDARANAEMHLKIWAWDGRSWSLNTRVDRPHGNARVTGMAFHPLGTNAQSWQLVTIGDDANVKTWKAKTVANERGRDETFWVSRSTFSWREQLPRALSWSPDGSILVVAYAAAVVLFDPDSNAVLQVLSCPEIKDIRSFAFVGTAGQYLAVASQREISVWDLVSGSVLWTHAAKQNVQQLVAHPRSDMFAAVQNPAATLEEESITIVRVFEITAGPRAVRKHKVPYPIRACAFFSLSSSPASSDFVLFGITLRWSVVLLGDDVTRPMERARAIVDDGSGTGASRTLLQDIFGASAILAPSAPSTAGPSASVVTRKKDPLYELELPAYEQPPLGRLFDSVMGRIVGKRALDVPPIADTSQMDVDQDPIVESGATLMQAASIEREPDKSELDALTQMFREVFVQPAPTVPKSTLHTNGNGNGLHKPVSTPKVNGHASAQKAKTKRTPATPLPSSNADVEMDVDSSPVTVGQKRKKSKI
ncbi:WD40 repeat-like protein [Exidia glandulosa HHB12029]|uniref:WD40 repeat-like protein n=1 Tax=Exidia glandulosa HHB12029 TaxID=1314781 RepID=A0A166AP28_EXIGL|nr:WD40 repeat-like protein [Exidia glandulosa HHB12029]